MRRSGLILALGLLVSLPATKRRLSFVEQPFTNLPVVKSISSSLKNFADYFAPHDQDTQQVVLLQVPGYDLGMIGLVTLMRAMSGAKAQISRVIHRLVHGTLLWFIEHRLAPI